MPIFIAIDYDNKIENIILAKAKELANAYWQGKDIYPHTIKELSEDDLKDHITGVLPILNTRMKNTNHLRPDSSIRIVCKI